MNANLLTNNPYLQLLRINDWFKNFFIVPGAFISLLMVGYQGNLLQAGIGLLGAFFLTSAVSSANYIINQIADLKQDAKHPQKKHRPLPSRKIYLPTAGLIMVSLLLISLIIAGLFYNTSFFLALLTLWVAGIFYNIRPIRLKDIPYIDVISESFNNPVRFLIGWFVITTTTFPPLEILLLAWVIGAVLMTAKRFDELRHYGKGLIPYRHTFNTYTLHNLALMMYLYSALSLGLFAHLALKYQKSLLLCLPILLMFLIWFTKKVKSGKAKAINIEAFVLSRGFVTYMFVIFIVFILTLL